MQVNEDKSGQVAGVSEPEPYAYSFCGFRLLAHQQRLEIDGEPAALTTKLYHLLLTFLIHPGEVVSKEAIVDAVWPGQVVTDAALAKQIQRLRSTLGDSERDPPLIETHRGRGYRLTCPVTVEHKAVVEQQSSDADNPPMTPASSPSTRRPTRLALAGIAAIALFALIAQNWPLTTPPTVSRIAVVPVANQTTALSEGAAEYLATRLGKPADLAPLLRSPEAPERSIRLGSLELFRLRKAPVTAVRLERQDGVFQLWIDVRNLEGSSSVEFKDASIAQLLVKGEEWMRENLGLDASTRLPDDAYVVSSHFEGLASAGCDRALQYFRAAMTRDPGFTAAQLRLARCEQARGNSREAAAAAIAVLESSTASSSVGIALDAHLVAARAFMELGDSTAARRQLEAAKERIKDASSPMQEMSALAALALLANMDGAVEEALELQQRRLQIAEEQYPLPSYVAGVHLDIAEIGLINGDYAAMRSEAELARALAEKQGDIETLMRSYRFLITSHFRADDMDSAVQLALAARPILTRSNDAASKAFFMQFAALALNARGYLTSSRDYTEELRRLGEATVNPMYGAIADMTVLHRLYIQNDFAGAHAFAASTRARLENEYADHSAIPNAMAFEALAASRGAQIGVAQDIIDEMETRYADYESLKGSTLRAKGHMLFRSGNEQKGLEILREAESATRAVGSTAVADFIGYEIIALRLGFEHQAPWDDVNRLTPGRQKNYFMSRLVAQAHALDGNFLAATTALQEARLSGNELWSTSDQLLLEMYRSELVAARGD